MKLWLNCTVDFLNLDVLIALRSGNSFQLGVFFSCLVADSNLSLYELLVIQDFVLFYCISDAIDLGCFLFFGFGEGGLV